jgi:chlorite dismutase
MTMSKYSVDKMLLNSDWIHEDVQQWLVRELYESPRVYLQLQDDEPVGAYLVYEPVNVTNASYLLKQRKKAGLIQEQVQITRTYTRVSQLG